MKLKHDGEIFWTKRTLSIVAQIMGNS